VKAYKITITGYKPFTLITETPESKIPEAIKEKFLVYPVKVKKL